MLVTFAAGAAFGFGNGAGLGFTSGFAPAGCGAFFAACFGAGLDDNFVEAIASLAERSIAVRFNGPRYSLPLKNTDGVPRRLKRAVS